MSKLFQIIDPRNYKPFHLYNGVVVDGTDVIDLMSEGFLRVVSDSRRV